MSTDVAPRLGAWQQVWRLLVAAAFGIFFWLSTGAVLPRGCATDTCSWFVTGDPLLALGCLTALLWQRRFPVAVALVAAIASAASTLATGAALLALCSLSTRRRPVEIGAVALVYVAASQMAGGLYPIEEIPSVPKWLEIALAALSAGIAAAIGLAIGARRVEVRSLRERAESAEREQAARAAQARAMERNRIAREMHDVLAHRISLVAMQAGVLDHRTDLPAEEHRVLVRGIADGSHEALEELREVLGVLRAGPDRPEPPQPSLDGIPDLVADAAASGLDVTFTDTVRGTPPDVIGRTCYRIVQEGLTNVAKHASGAHVDVTIEGTTGDELRVSVRNSSGSTTITRKPTSGFGLLGLSERIVLAGGELDHHPTPGNGYLLTARLPWPDHDQRKELTGG
ncbi:two-component sensor histidine kinase [Prauserella marina]|uniref:histidine kinase n=1 Tax=Prauserella marina TaxID=530584 RepID=A0A222VUI8_9PSEU|nr:histidine kinase [Prauserella marina]ASR37587.1 two-component sensor histidine kinase [Prauserella marina]PWV75494.1 signal transduction histidine kinase [Prauserella marina]SDD33286.1 Signal transduction histidine kinase [Prauserella marina]